MGIMNLIRQQKAGFRKQQTDRSHAHNVAAAEELQALKEKRIQVEGKAKLRNLAAQERSRISTGQQTIKDTSKGRRLAKNMAKFMNEGKTKLNQMKSGGSSKGFDPGVGSGSAFGGGGSNAFGGSSKGFDAGGGSNPFSPAPQPSKKPVKVVTRYYNK